ncbi:MAG TPA: hypothetical protein VK540_04210 [Polyangiaceae bacterium]|nr:hypothetical protein [Polyangiaceae bacterium]
MKRPDSFGMPHVLLLGCAVLFACAADTDPGSRSTGGRSGGASTGTTSGTAGASTGGATTSTSGTTSGGSSSGATSGSGGATGGTTSGGGSAGQGGQGGTGAGGGGGQGGTGTGGAGGQGGTGTGGAGTEGGTPDGGGKDASAEVGRGDSGGSEAGGSDTSVGDAGFPPITECPKPSVDRLQVWTSSGPAEGTTIPPTGDLLVMDGGRYVAKVQFLNVEWHVCPVYLGNQFSANANLSASSGFMLTYSSTSDMYVQARPTSHWNGGDQWATKIPSTGGMTVTQFFSFDPANWKSIFGTPTWTFADTLKEVLGFVFVGQTPNTITFYGLRFDGYIPPCR